MDSVRDPVVLKKLEDGKAEINTSIKEGLRS